MKRICIVGPCLTMGGMERASSNFANELAAYGVSVHYVAILQKERFFELDATVDFHEPNGFNAHKMSIPRTLSWLRKTLKAINPDSTLVFGQFYAALTVMAAAGTGYKIFISERSSPLLVWPFKIRWFNKLAFGLFPPAGVVAQTSIAAAYQQRYYGAGTPIKVVPNPVRNVRYYPELERQPIVLAVGRMNDHLKGFDRLVEAFASANAPAPWRLVFAGDNDNADSLMDLAKQWGIQDRIDFLGKVKDIYKVLATASIFVIPSRSEGFPNALCEAMAAGVACISFDFVAGPRDMIENGQNGLLVEDGNIPHLAQAIQDLILHPEQRTYLGNNARSIAEQLHPNAVVKTLFEFIA